MFKHTANSRVLWQAFALACTIAGSIAAASAAVAGDCPADKSAERAPAGRLQGRPGVTDTVLGSIALGKEPARSRVATCAFADSRSSLAASCPGTATAIGRR